MNRSIDHSTGARLHEQRARRLHQLASVVANLVEVARRDSLSVKTLLAQRRARRRGSALCLKLHEDLSNRPSVRTGVGGARQHEVGDRAASQALARFRHVRHNILIVLVRFDVSRSDLKIYVRGGQSNRQQDSHEM